MSKLFFSAAWMRQRMNCDSNIRPWLDVRLRSKADVERRCEERR